MLPPVLRVDYRRALFDGDNRFLLNNGGYTIERLIHGMTASYNTVPIWDYAGLFQAFGPEFKTKSYLVKTPDQLDQLLADRTFNEASMPQVRFARVLKQTLSW